MCSTVLVADGSAGRYTDRASTAPWTRPSAEFVEAWGLFTAAEFALIARRHMDNHGTTPEQMATVAAIIRNNGHVNPEAVYFGRGPFTADDVLASRVIAEPFHLLDCATTSEGACAVILTSAERARDLPRQPIYILGGGVDYYGNSYEHPPSFDLTGRDPRYRNGYVGRAAAERAFQTGGCRPADVDVCEFYDPFSFEIIRQLEAYGFCEEGAGAEYACSGVIGPGGRHPVTTDGGTMSFSHSGSGSQNLQRVARATSQLRGECATMQVADPQIAMCSNGGAGALMTRVMLLGVAQP
jgi:acetyl-CoA acetyltransferase